MSEKLDISEVIDAAIFYSGSILKWTEDPFEEVIKYLDSIAVEIGPINECGTGTAFGQDIVVQTSKEDYYKMSIVYDRDLKPDSVGSYFKKVRPVKSIKYVPVQGGL